MRDAAWLTQLSNALVPVLAPSAEEGFRPARRRRPPHTLAIQLALVLTGVRRAYMFDHLLPEGREEALAQALRETGQARVAILLLRLAPGERQVLVVNPDLVNGAVPSVIRVAEGHRPAVVAEDEGIVQDLAVLVADVSRAVAEGGTWALTPSEVGNMPALAGWLLEYEAVYSLSKGLVAKGLERGQFDLRPLGGGLPPPPPARESGNSLGDQPLVVFSVFLVFDTDQVDVMAFSLPEVCSAPSLARDISLKLKKRYEARLRAWPGARVRVETTKVQLGQVAL